MSINVRLYTAQRFTALGNNRTSALNTMVFKPVAELLKVRKNMPTIKYIVPGFRNNWLVNCSVLKRYNNSYLIEYYDEMAEDWVTVVCSRTNLVFPKFSELIF